MRALSHAPLLPRLVTPPARCGRPARPQGVPMSIRDKCARLVRSPGRLATGLLALTLTAASAIGLTAPTIVPAAVAEPAAAQPAAVPAPPAGFTTTWSDDFTGAANTGLDTGTWRYDAGPGSSF